MIAAGLGIATAAVVIAVGAPPSVDSIRSLVEGAAAAIAVFGGILGLWRFRRLSSAQREDLEASAAQRAVQAMEAVLDQYVKELKGAKESIKGLEEKLAAANERILRLEEQLRHAIDERNRIAEQSRVEREQLQNRLDSAVEERIGIEKELQDVREQVEDLQLRVGGRRSSDHADDEPPEPQ